MTNSQGFSIAPADLIVGLGRGLELIKAVDDAHPRLSVSALAARTGIPRPAARRHLLSLCYFGYAQTDAKLYWLALRVLRLGLLAAQRGAAPKRWVAAHDFYRHASEVVRSGQVLHGWVDQARAMGYRITGQLLNPTVCGAAVMLTAATAAARVC